MAGRSTVENVDVTLNATDKASKVVDGVADRLEALDDVELEVGADDKASKTLEAVDADRKKLDGADATVELDDHGGAKLQSDIHDILAGAQRVDETHAELDVSIDPDGLAKTRRGFSDVEGDATRLDSSVTNSTRDMLGVFGDVGGVVGDFGEAFVGAAEVAGPALAKVGLSVESLVGPLAVGGIAFGAVKYFWDNFVGGANQAKDKLLEVQKAMASGDMVAAAEGIVKALDPWRSTMDDLGVSVKTATDFITGQTDVLPLNEQKMNDHRSAEFFLTQELIRQQDAWKANHASLLTQQTDQFNALRAIGGTTDAMLTQAEKALPELQAGILRYIAVQEGIPEEKITTILTDADPNDVAQVRAELDELAKRRTAVVDVTANTEAAERSINSLVDEISRKQARLAIGANAMAGTPYAAGGVYTVGEAGPERVILPRGSRVLTAGQTAGLARREAAAATTIINVTVNVPVGTPTAEVGRYVAAAIDLHERRAGRRRRAVA